MLALKAHQFLWKNELVKNTTLISIATSGLFGLIVVALVIDSEPIVQNSTQIQADQFVGKNVLTKHQKSNPGMTTVLEPLPETHSISGEETDRELSPGEIDEQLQSLDSLSIDLIVDQVEPPNL